VRRRWCQQTGGGRAYRRAMVRRRGWVVVSAVVLATLAACGSDSKSADTSPGSAATTSAASTTLASVSSTPPAPNGPSTSRPLEVANSTPGSVPEGLQPAVDIAVADLAGHLSVDAGKIVTVSARDVTWPDGAIGCPQPGMMYTQVQVDGAEIILQVDGISYRYTLGGSKGPTLCTTG
jgi:hypothetical protein